MKGGFCYLCFRKGKQNMTIQCKISSIAVAKLYPSALKALEKEKDAVKQIRINDYIKKRAESFLCKYLDFKAPSVDEAAFKIKDNEDYLMQIYSINMKIEKLHTLFIFSKFFSDVYISSSDFVVLIAGDPQAFNIINPNFNTSPVSLSEESNLH